MELAEVGIIASCALFGLVFLFLVVSGNIKKIHTLEQKVETLEKNLLDLTDDTYSTREKPFKAKHGEKTCDTCLHIERCKELNQGSDEMLKGCRICKCYDKKEVQDETN